MKRILLLLILLSAPIKCSFAQNFHKIYPYDVYMKMTDIYPTDSCYYFVACHGTVPYTESEMAFGKLDLNGNIVFQNSFAQVDTANYPNRTYAELQTNYKGNFIVTHSTQTGVEGWFPRILEISPNGNLINDFTIDITAPDSVSMGDNGLMIIDPADSTYNIMYTYMYKNLDNNPPGPQYSNGAIWMKIDQFGDTLWTKRYHTSQSLHGNERYTPIAFQSINDSVNLMVCRNYQYYGSIFMDSDNWSVMHFVWLDKSGNILTTKTMQHTTVCYGGSGLIHLPDSTMIYEYDESFLYPWSPTVDNYRYIPYVTRLDQDLNPIWKDTLLQFSASNFGVAGMLRKVQPDSDTSFVYGYCKGTYTDSVYFNGYIYARMERRGYSGDIKWNRNFYFYPDTSLDTYPATYEIRDIETTPDHGYIMSGSLDCVDSMYAQAPYEYGYIIKTNCLGFVGSPEAGVQYQNLGDLRVEFINTSTEAGSFDWYFGDGYHLHTDENKDTLIYEYNTLGPHDAMLVAHGCDGESDTVFFEVNPVYHFDPLPITEGQGYFSIFPNPISSGDYLFIYLNNVDLNDDLNMRIFSEDGKLVSKFNLEAFEGNHFIQQNYRSGMYHAVLYNGSEILQQRKFVVF